MPAISTLFSRFLQRAPAPSSGFELLGNTLLYRASIAGADRISFGTPAGCEAPAPPSSLPEGSSVAVWFRHNNDWSYFSPLSANIVLCLLNHIESRVPGLPLPQRGEGFILQIDHKGKKYDLRIRVGIETQGTFVIDLLPK
jgi:hypothetical protein